ncbi:bifunctional folylpolyglutamate synthase/dihydrofolate synthase [bacterium]|nr:bifunctional folylpolyglutamate synthase/dihydrofolate synthase [bacterium]
MDNYTNAVNLLQRTDKFCINLGLDRIKSFLDIVGNPQDKLNFIHIAGTNGKGSVCTILESVLRTAGYKTGLFTSPHILEYTERIKYNGEEIDKDKFAELIFKVEGVNDIKLTEFEILTTVMFLYFAEKMPDIVILETGLGGRLDATNVIKENICSVITHLDLEHTERLGNTIEKIAFEKAGIIKKNCPLVTKENYEIIKETAKKQNSEILPIFNAEKLTEFLSLKGEYQKENLTLAYSVIKNCFNEIPEGKIIDGLKNVRHICRFEYIKEKNIILDGAHNPNGITELKKSLDKNFPKSEFKRRFVFGCLKNKDYKKMVKTLFEEDDEVLFYHFKHQNSCTFEDLHSIYPDSKEFFVEDFKPDENLTVFCGSLYMLGEIYKNILLP